MISDLYKKNDLERHFFALAPRAADEGRLVHKLGSLLAALQTWVVILATWWGWR